MDKNFKTSKFKNDENQEKFKTDKKNSSNPENQKCKYPSIDINIDKIQDKENLQKQRKIYRRVWNDSNQKIDTNSISQIKAIEKKLLEKYKVPIKDLRLIINTITCLILMMDDENLKSNFEKIFSDICNCKININYFYN